MGTAEAINILASRVCRCGAPKGRRHVFCGTCYGSLPEDLRRGLWQRIGQGFEGAYEAAIKWLKAR